MKVGSLIKFDNINGHTYRLNRKMGVYLGEAFITRIDGVVVENHKVLMNGDMTPTIIDRRLLLYMKEIK